MCTEDLEMVGALQQARLAEASAELLEGVTSAQFFFIFLQNSEPDGFVHIHTHFKIQPGRQDWGWRLEKETKYAITFLQSEFI